MSVRKSDEHCQDCATSATLTSSQIEVTILLISFQTEEIPKMMAQGKLTTLWEIYPGSTLTKRDSIDGSHLKSSMKSAHFTVTTLLFRRWGGRELDQKLICEILIHLCFSPTASCTEHLLNPVFSEWERMFSRFKDGNSPRVRWEQGFSHAPLMHYHPRATIDEICYHATRYEFWISDHIDMMDIQVKLIRGSPSECLRLWMIYVSVTISNGAVDESLLYRETRWVFV